MKLNLSKVVQGAIALAIFSIGTKSHAQDFSKMAVVDYNTILKDYYKAKDSQKQMEDLAAGYQKERNEREAGLKTLDAFLETRSYIEGYVFEDMMTILVRVTEP